MAAINSGVPAVCSCGLSAPTTPNPSSIDAVQLEDTLGDVQTDCGNLHGGWLLLLVALNGPSLAHRCRQGVVHRIRFSQPVSSTIRAAVVDATALTAEERRQRARAAILAAFAERPPRVIEGNYRVLAGNEVPAEQAKREASDESEG